MFKLEVRHTGLVVTAEKPSDIKFWIKNEIGNYKDISTNAENWCKTAKIGEVYHSEDNLIVVTNEN